ncbi:hypothetical protein KIN20_000949 [Parelaphostrongylus tenuis]|uniref:Uncharacterized protein n=1 Tax=Parelaphostrongylus tenuis TaxID=148309 RepID=A0AAD5QFY0_PARTN|nr:hypothetical protein KIN20_000949 [Parelaphostrongylus tenuis]
MPKDPKDISVVFVDVQSDAEAQHSSTSPKFLKRSDSDGWQMSLWASQPVQQLFSL